MSTRLSFFIKHFIISVLISLLVLYVVFFMWYPVPLAKAMGVIQIFLILLLIDVIIGPVLGFIIYKEGKKTLKFDLACIIMLQFLALTYGIYTIAQGRAVWIVFTNERFELVRENEIIKNNINKEYPKTSLFKPQFISIKPAQTFKQKNDDVVREVMKGISIAQLSERYQSLNSAKNTIIYQARDLRSLYQYNDAETVRKNILNYPTANAWLPLKASAVDMVVLINKEKGEVVKIVDLRPWK